MVAIRNDETACVRCELDEESYESVLANADLQPGSFVLSVEQGNQAALEALLRCVGENGHVVALHSDRKTIYPMRDHFIYTPNIDFLCTDALCLRPADGLYHAIVLHGDASLGCRNIWGMMVHLTRLLLDNGKLIVSLSCLGCGRNGQAEPPHAKDIAEMMGDLGLRVHIDREDARNKVLVVGVAALE